ncbi:protein CPR-5 isoform X2 [Aristolochia californica]|uniref:protein CPR-5 isoform X2 n=1 Tax=Aristolochia californica TaxID=171875 RepID=UPI0035D84665
MNASAFLSPCSHKSSISTKTPQIDASCVDGNDGIVLENGEEVCSSNFLSRCDDSLNVEGKYAPIENTQSGSARAVEVDSPKRLKFLQKKEKGASRKSKRMIKFSDFLSASHERGINVGMRRRNWRAHNGDELHSLGLSLGMYIAAVVVQVCVSAVKESISNVFGERFHPFIQSFEKSFDSTLKTLRLINGASIYEEKSNNRSYISEEPSSFVSHDPTVSCSHNPCNCSEGIEETRPSESILNQLVLHGKTNQQLACSSVATCGSGYGQSILGTWEKSIMEQTRSNDLKTVEISLNMQRLRLKQSQLDVSSSANVLEKFKLAMGISKASFKEEKLKTQMQEKRSAELVNNCIDCLVAGLLIMSTCLGYGASIHSYELLKEVTRSCSYNPKQTSWWTPNPFGSFTALFHLIKCHIVVLSRIMFGLLMILALAYALLQRWASSGQTMPITFILLLLGVVCGFAGKICVDTLGASGSCWLFYWEVLCCLHFFANVFTPIFFEILYGPISVRSDDRKERVWVPYKFRRVMFYSSMFLVPVLCGLMPFASSREWKDHFVDRLSNQVFGEGS